MASSNSESDLGLACAFSVTGVRDTTANGHLKLMGVHFTNYATDNESQCIKLAAVSPVEVQLGTFTARLPSALSASLLTLSIKSQLFFRF